MSSPSYPRPDSEEPEMRNWLDLPRDVTLTILQKFGTVQTLNSTQWVCTQWWRICKDPLMWRSIDLRWSETIGLNAMQLGNMCRHAIDLSCGHLEDITLQFNATVDLLHYIADSACHLRRLRLLQCNNISNKGFSEVAKKLPWLEELDVSICCNISKDALQAVGLCCPLLKSLKFNRKFDKYHLIQCNEEAFAIAKTMPQLDHLQLVGNPLTDDGVLAIVDSCPHLKSLDIRRCLNVKFGVSLGRKCAEKVKDLRYPNDSTEDYPFVTEVYYGDGYSLVTYLNWCADNFPGYDVDIFDLDAVDFEADI